MREREKENPQKQMTIENSEIIRLAAGMELEDPTP